MITSTPEMAKTETLGHQTLVQITHNKCIKEWLIIEYIYQFIHLIICNIEKGCPSAANRAGK